MPDVVIVVIWVAIMSVYAGLLLGRAVVEIVTMHRHGFDPVGAALVCLCIFAAVLPFGAAAAVWVVVT